MKQITRRIVALLASAVTAITTLSVSYSEAFAETPQDSSTSTSDTDYEVKSTGLFGTFLSDEMNETVSGEQEKQSLDYAVYKLDFNSDTGSFVADYKAVADCTLFIGFYNDEGTVLFSSIKKDILASPNGQAEITVDVVLPDYYLVKAFVIGENQQPLCKPKVYDKFTKAMQEILAKTTEDFEKDKVINLDENNENNFVVMNDGVIEITSSETVDTFVKTDDDGRHIFKNAVEIAKLEKGSKAVVYTDYTIIAFVVGDIIKDDNNVTIIPSDADISEVFSFIKIDGSECGKESKVFVDEDNENNPEDVVYLGHKREEVSAERKNAPGKSFDLTSQDRKGSDGKVDLPKMSDTFTFNLLGDLTNGMKDKPIANLTFGVTADLEIYYSIGILGVDYLSITGTLDFKVDVTIGVSKKISPKSWELLPLNIFNVGVAVICITPTIEIIPDGSLTFSYSRTYDIGYNSNDGLDWNPRDPIVGSIVGKVSVEIRVVGKGELEIFGWDIFDIEPYIGIKISASTTIGETNSDYTWHKCKDCASISISFTAGFSITLDLLFTRCKWKIIGIEKPIGKWYWSSDIGWGTDECPNQYHQICVTLKDKKTKKPITDAKLYYGTQVSSSNLIKQMTSDNAVTIDSNGKAKFWVKESELKEKSFCVTAETSNKEVGHCIIGCDFDAKSRKLQNFDLYIKTKTSGSNQEDEDDSDDSEETSDIGALSSLGGFCGVFDTDNVFYMVKKDVCYVFGEGPVNGQIIDEALKRVSIDSLRKVVFCNGIKMTYGDNTSFFNYFPVEEIEFQGDNGDVIRYSFTPACCQSLTDLKLVGFEKIDSSAFSGCINLTNVSWPDSLKEIGYDAFADNRSLEEIVFPKNLKTIGQAAFRGCVSLRNVTLNNGLEKIESRAFAGTGIKSISIPASVETLGMEAFRDCYNLKSVIINGDFKTNGIPFWNSPVETCIINDGVTVIDERVFQGSEQLKNVRFSRNLKTIGMGAFQDTHRLTKITLPNSLKTIESAAFSNSGLTSVTVPRNVTTIGDSAFDTSTLTDIVFLNPDKSSADYTIGKTIVNKDTTIWGYKGSAIEKYANDNHYKFKAIGETTSSGVTTTAVTTTVTTTTTTVAVVTTQVAPDAECVFIAVKDENTVNGSADEILDKENVKFFDQKTADSDGVVSFSYLPDEKEKWAFIFVSEAINDTITKAFGTPDDLKTTTYNVAPGVKGDANGDGEIDMSDVVLIMQALANPNKYGIDGSDAKHITESGFKFADSDGDGLTVNDALRIQQYLLGLIPSLT